MIGIFGTKYYLLLHACARLWWIPVDLRRVWVWKWKRSGPITYKNNNNSDCIIRNNWYNKTKTILQHSRYWTERLAFDPSSYAVSIVGIKWKSRAMQGTKKMKAGFVECNVQGVVVWWLLQVYQYNWYWLSAIISNYIIKAGSAVKNWIVIIEHGIVLYIVWTQMAVTVSLSEK